MRNRAKCKLCGDVIESFHSTDHVQCSCGEIDVFGGDALRCAAKNFSNFIRVDDKGNEIVPIIKNSPDDPVSANIYPQHPLSKADLHLELEQIITRYDSLPRHVLDSPVSHTDLLSVLLLLQAILRAD